MYIIIFSLELGPGLQSGLRIAEGTSKILTPDMISVTDPDSTNADLVITLVPANGNTVMPGHIENERFSGQARNSFTLEDLSNGRVSFVHQVNILFEIYRGPMPNRLLYLGTITLLLKWMLKVVLMEQCL